VAKMTLATGLMIAACIGLRYVPGWPQGATTRGAAIQLCAVMGVGAVVYFGAWKALSRARTPF